MNGRKPSLKQIRVRKNRNCPWDWQQAFKNAHATELTHATRFAKQHVADWLPWSRIPALFRRCCQSEEATWHSWLYLKPEVEPPERKLKGYAVGAWGNLCKAELPSGAKRRSRPNH
jgi:hypothetical protein